MKRVVLICSGGMDSVVLLKSLIEQKNGVHILNFSYGSKHNEKERNALRQTTKHLSVPFSTYDLPVDVDTMNVHGELIREGLLSSDLLKSGQDIPEGHYADDNMKKTVVPFRNGIMLALAVGFAESHACSQVLLASHLGDRHQYPDCRPEFTAAMRKASQLGTFGGIDIVAPFENLTKAGIVELGLRLHVRFDLTWSCYKGQDRPCLKCGTCEERISAFYENHTKDPLLTDEEWQLGVSNMLQVEQEWKASHAR